VADDAIPRPWASVAAVHYDGSTWWHSAPLPKRRHRCQPWTVAIDPPPTSMLIFRCACGALRIGGNGPWLERNSRRRARRCTGCASLLEAMRLLEILIPAEPTPCWFDSRGVCTEHGYPSDAPGHCAIADARTLLARAGRPLIETSP